MWRDVLRRTPTVTFVRPLAYDATRNALPLDPHRLLVRKVFRVTRFYGRKCRDPLFQLVNNLYAARAGAVPVPLLHQCGLTVHEFALWRPIVYARNWDTITRRLEQHGIEFSDVKLLTGPNDVVLPERPQPPSWLVFFLLCYKVKRPDDAQKAMALAYHHFPAAAPHLRPALFVFAACWLAEHDQRSALDVLVRQFLNISASTPLQDHDFQALLQVLAYASTSKDTAAIASTILAAMKKRGIGPNENTYDALLASRICTPFLGHIILRHMKARGYRPTVKHLTRFVEIFASPPWKQRAQMCLRLLREAMAEKTRTAPESRIDALPVMHQLSSSLRSEARFLATFESTRALHSNLRLLTARQSQTQPLDSSLKKGRRVDDSRAANIGFGDSWPESSDEDQIAKNATGTSPMLDTTGRPSPHFSGQLSSLLHSSGAVTRIIGSAATWRSTIRVAARDRKLSSEQLLHIFEQATSYHPILRSDMASHLFAIQGLLRRGAHSMALQLWNQVNAHRDKFSKWVVSVGIQAMTLGGEAGRALSLLQELSSNRHYDLFDTQTINVFMASLQRAGHSDAVFQLWDNMGHLFNVGPDCYTITILLKTARFSSRAALSIQGTLTELGLGGLFKQPIKSDQLSPNALKDEAFSRVHAMLLPGAKATNGLWKGERAGTIALRVAQDALFANRPNLKNVQAPPVYALRPTADFQAFFPMSDLFRSVMGRTIAADQSEDVSSTKNTREAPTTDYSRVLPNDVMFRAYIDVLASESCIPQIPLALAWMQHLNIIPTQNTLATALVYWAEVGMDAPLIERWKGGQSEYGRLMEWMREWVGNEGMPTDEHIGIHIRRLKYFREARPANLGSSG